MIARYLVFSDASVLGMTWGFSASGKCSHNDENEKWWRQEHAPASMLLVARLCFLNLTADVAENVSLSTTTPVMANYQLGRERLLPQDVSRHLSLLVIEDGLE